MLLGVAFGVGPEEERYIDWKASFFGLICLAFGIGLFIGLLLGFVRFSNLA